MQYITGNKFKKISHYSYDEYGFIKQTEPQNNEILKIFVKIDYVHNFFNRKQERKYILITHNGDLSVDSNYLRYLDDPNLIKWYGQNIMLNHPKLVSIPIGIANESWPHGDEKIFNKVIDQNIKKERLIYANFDVSTNRQERNYCLSELKEKGIEINSKLPFKEYLQEIAKSYFVISPNGNGIDCHKTWEALYLGAIPIVTKSINTDFYSDYPLMIIKDWLSVDLNNFTVDLYNKKWNNFDPNKLFVNKLINE